MSLYQQGPAAREKQKRVNKVYTTRTKRIDFAIGFVGWIVIAGALWLIAISIFGPLDTPGVTGTLICAMPILFGANITVLIVLAYRRKWIALGMLSVLAVNLFIELILRVGYNATCAVPVYVEPGFTLRTIQKNMLPPTPTATVGPTPTYVPTSLPATVDPDAAALAQSGVITNSQWKPYIQDINGVKMVLTPEGCFMMGSNSGDENEKPVNKQCFDRPFWIDMTEVTNSQFRQFGGQAAQRSVSTEDNHPREEITWHESAAFCERRGARLPTEAEWEYAARGPDNLIYPWGNDFDPDKIPSLSSGSETVDVGSRPTGASWVGAVDMSGNVAEWVSSLYEPYPYDKSDGREAQADGVGTVRGGNLLNGDRDTLRSSRRHTYFRPTQQDGNTGFRCTHSY